MRSLLHTFFFVSCLIVTACGDGIDENLTDDQQFLVALEGTWIGTADDVSTMSGSQSVVIEMTLPDNGKPTLSGLTGSIRFGVEIDDSQVDPDNPQYTSTHDIRDGFVFKLENMAIVKDRLLAEFYEITQWNDFCEAQTKTYGEEGFYKCSPDVPGWWGECTQYTVGPNGERGCIYHGPNGEEVFISEGKLELCMDACTCDISSCEVNSDFLVHSVELDITVDIENGVMLGTGGVGRIEAVKCDEGYHPDVNGNCVLDENCPVPDPCGSHSTCDDSAGAVVCVCEPGYSGDACDQCASDYHDDGSGSCVVNEKCPIPDPCGIHEVCDDSSGVVACVCASGYSGDNCDVCASGYRDDGSGTCVWDGLSEMLTVPSGNFWMGCNETVDTNCDSDEYPYHEVYLDAFDIDITEVTQAQYKKCLDEGDCTKPQLYDECWDPVLLADYPVACVDWYQAGMYCAWAGRRLCTEAEWEKAARGDDGRLFPWGNEPATCEYAVIDDIDSGGNGCGTQGTMPVGSKPNGSSPYGVFDMAGNVQEWVSDRYAEDYYQQSPSSNPAGPQEGSRRVMRGGSFVSDWLYQRVSARNDRLMGNPTEIDGGIGIRCCR